jgi:hypothetical protein
MMPRVAPRAARLSHVLPAIPTAQTARPHGRMFVDREITRS